MGPIDSLLNKFTMYRLLVYVLSIYIVLGIAFAFMGKLPDSPTALVVSLFILITSAYITDRGLGAFFSVPTNMESSLITSMILFLIIQPAHTVAAGLALVLGGAISSASKFLIAWNGKHIFNPAAFAAAVPSLTSLEPATWWIGNMHFWPFTLILGAVIARKIRRFPMVITFAVVTVTVQAYLILHAGQTLDETLKHAILASPLIFLSTVMLTEPATMPPRRNLQIVFAALVGTLVITGWKLGPLVIYPEVALLIGNLFAWLVSPKYRVRLHLKEVQKISERVYNYIFEPERRFRFLPGQYMEWTLANVPYDSRGNRRTFTIASSPTEETVQLGLKYYEPASTYKSVLFDMQPGDVMYASQLAGNFTLKGSEKKKLVFIAGGIGITPFRSMAKYLTDKSIDCDIVLLYLVGDPKEFAYVKEFKEAGTVGLRTVPIITNSANSSPGIRTAKFSPELIKESIPDYADRTFYISGPNNLVDAAKSYLGQLNVPRHHIKTDHFSGY